jgi:hypothetical protein
MVTVKVYKKEILSNSAQISKQEIYRNVVKINNNIRTEKIKTFKGKNVCFHFINILISNINYLSQGCKCFKSFIFNF